MLSNLNLIEEFKDIAKEFIHKIWKRKPLISLNSLILYPKQNLRGNAARNNLELYSNNKIKLI